MDPNLLFSQGVGSTWNLSYKLSLIFGSLMETKLLLFHGVVGHVSLCLDLVRHVKWVQTMKSTL